MIIESVYILLQYACDIEAEIVGKPSNAFFNAVLQDMGQPAESVSFIL
jgi:ribonucleotide monophosphatase NagD (HAD superfamily)